MLRYYSVAGHAFSIATEADICGMMDNYEPFRLTEPWQPGTQMSSPAAPRQSLFSLTVERGEAVDYTVEMHQEEEGQEIVCGHTAEGHPVFEFRWWHETAGWLVCTPDYGEGRLISTGASLKAAIDNALMILYALTTAPRQTALFHAAVVGYQGRGYMVLGKSGTGKSTHARLWLRYIEGSELVNDDNPVVRILPEGTFVYGSPWSGKTPCYRNMALPLGGCVQLSQAPYNKIRRMGGIEAYAALMPSISGKRWDKAVADGLHETENTLASTTPCWHLECLPDEAAARLCAGRVKMEDGRGKREE